MRAKAGMRKAAATILLLCVALAPISVARASGDAPAEPRGLRVKGPRHVPHEVIVRYRAGVAGSLRRATAIGVGASRFGHLPLRGTSLVRLAKGLSVDEAINELESRPEVLYAEPNYLYRAAVIPNDPLLDSTWALSDTLSDNDIDAPQAWDITTGSDEITVAVADTGIAYDHPDIAPNVWTNDGEAGAGRGSNGVDDDDNGFVDDLHGWDWVGNDNGPYDLLGHGTHVAGTIGARGNDATGIAGINWNVALMPLTVMNSAGVGTTADLVAGIVYARNNGARILNASLGGPDYSRTLASAIANSPDLLVVTASGNEGKNVDDDPDYPCSFDLANVVCVGASNQRDDIPFFSNYGDQNVDLVAPGTTILSTAPHIETRFSEEFDGDVFSRWISGGTNDSWGQESTTFGSHVSDSPSGDYPNSTDSWLQTKDPIDLSDTSACDLSFLLNLRTQQGRDGIIVESSVDAMTWKRVVAISGDSDGWERFTTSLDFDGDELYIRFRLSSDASITDDGALIDRVRVKCASSDYDANDYAIYSGTSMAAPHVAGAAALLWAAAPEATRAEIKKALMTGVDPIPDAVGTTVSNGRLNLHLALVALDLPPVVGAPLPSTSPSPSPVTSPSPEPTVEHTRSVTLSLRRHLIAKGTVSALDGFAGCASGTVKILRKGHVIRRVAVNAGAFRVRLPDRRGRYSAVAARLELEGHVCAAARSVVRRHRH